MREIKFRGKRIDNGEWVYGYFGIKGKDTDLEEYHIIVSTFQNTDNIGVYPFYFTDILIEKETVGQFTGFHDKNGVEIYEGDVVKSTYGEQKGQSGSVFFSKGSYRVIGVTLDDFLSNMCSKFYIKGESIISAEVTGNIHERSE